MATELRNIEVTQLPLELNFQELKSQGLAYIEAHSNTNWTNFNPSDPGVTILEQLCYAYTELGYCGDFPMKDILTEKNGDLHTKNEFFLPQDIFTTSPITVDDFRKILIDRLEAIKNASLLATKTLYPFLNGYYQPLLIQTGDLTNTLLDAGKYELNTCRNLGEYFIEPEFFTEVSYNLSGSVTIQKGSDPQEVYNEIFYQISNYVFPEVTQMGYDNLVLKGESASDIYDGPELKNGYIATNGLFAKNNKVTTYELSEVIKTISDVETVFNLSFTNTPDDADSPDGTKPSSTLATSGDTQIIVFSIDSLAITIEGSSQTPQVSVEKGIQSEKTRKKGQVDKVSTVNMAPKVPQGSYREITDYYSIQYTFPEAYPVGPNAVDGNSTAFQIAQSRQLKGYLTLCDQLLANQFAQLANLGKLFSFKNSITGTPYDLGQYKAKMTKFEKLHQQYPAPFQSFSPTYYYQSLYDSVPDITKLLKNYDAFRFTFDSQESDKSLDKKSWDKYKQSPYNSYIWGLMYYMEKEDINLPRRNDILNHLLARHGESPLYIDTVIYDTIYSGSMLKDQVIVKSLYLQNLQRLTYNRAKGYNFIGCSKLIELSDLDLKYDVLIQKLQAYLNVTPAISIDESQVTNTIEVEAERMFEEYISWDQHDFIFNVEKIDKCEKVSQQNAIDYSGIELKLNLLLSVNQQYQKFLTTPVDQLPETTFQHTTESYQTLLWMRYMRKGMLMIETNLLLTSATFCVADERHIDYASFIQKYASGSKDRVDVEWDGDVSTTLKDTLFEYTIVFIFPDFLQEVPNFTDRVDTFLDNELTPSIQKKVVYATEEELTNFIPKYVDWHNAVRYQDPNANPQVTVYPSQDAGALYTALSSLITNQSTTNE